MFMAQRLLVALLLLAVPGRAQSPPPAPPATPPRLLVILVVDQMRADYVQQYGHQWTRGLRRLHDTSATFPLAAYPYALTVTCAGHATISTGQFPSRHGMVGNGWHDRDIPKNVTCTEDPTVSSVPFGGREGRERHGPKYLLASTLTDELRQQRPEPPIVVGLSLKARSALTLAGHPSPSTYAVWEEEDGTWATSTAYATTAWPAVDNWARANAIDQAYGTEWTRLLPESRYEFDDWQPGEPEAGTFPHALVSQSGTPDAAFAGRWERSPLSDAALGSLAAHLVGQLRMGQTTGRTDVLAVSFSALDLVGHAFGPSTAWRRSPNRRPASSDRRDDSPGPPCGQPSSRR
jgi:hypothetical protein